MLDLLLSNPQNQLPAHSDFGRPTVFLRMRQTSHLSVQSFLTLLRHAAMRAIAAVRAAAPEPTTTTSNSVHLPSPEFPSTRIKCPSRINELKVWLEPLCRITHCVNTDCPSKGMPFFANGLSIGAPKRWWDALVIRNSVLSASGNTSGVMSRDVGITRIPGPPCHRILRMLGF